MVASAFPLPIPRHDLIDLIGLVLGREASVLLLQPWLEVIDDGATFAIADDLGLEEQSSEEPAWRARPSAFQACRRGCRDEPSGDPPRLNAILPWRSGFEGGPFHASHFRAPHPRGGRGASDTDTHRRRVAGSKVSAASGVPGVRTQGTITGETR